MEKTDADFELKSPEQIHYDFKTLELQCLGYEDYVNAEEKNYIETLENLRKLVLSI